MTVPMIATAMRATSRPYSTADAPFSSFFMITGFHGTHVTIGVIFLIIIARKVLRAAGAAGIFSLLMGTEVAPRRDFIVGGGESSRGVHDPEVRLTV